MNQSEFFKFEQCKFRTRQEILKKSCCSNKTFKAYGCVLKKIFPLSPETHCKNCKEFSQ